MTDFTEYVDLAAAKVGGQALYANDEFFAPKENLLQEGRGVFIEGKYTEFGKWMDGWESRRKRGPGYDWCILQLGMPGIIHGFDVDTNHFLGNFPEHCSIDVCHLSANATVDELNSPHTPWVELVPKTLLQGGSRNLFPVSNGRRWTHVRLNIYPDGGVARFRVHGQAVPDWGKVLHSGQPINLAALEYGATVEICNDNFFSPKENLILPGRAAHMGEGWETRRKRGPGHDWVVVKLAATGSIHKIEVDTAWFKGNYPDRFSLEGCVAENVPVAFLKSNTLAWQEILPQTKLHPDHQHFYELEIVNPGPFTHVRLNIYPDGGISRLRLWGRLTDFETLNHAPSETIRQALSRCCGSTAWVENLLPHFPVAGPHQLQQLAQQHWWELKPADWLEAFTHHPKIGDMASLKAKFANTADLAGQEQAGAAQASEAVLQQLAEGNQRYEAKFGYIFIVCATGKSAAEMLALLEARLDNDPATELVIAATEQSKITRLRLEKWSS